jgi:hypothetical protein
MNLPPVTPPAPKKSNIGRIILIVILAPIVLFIGSAFVSGFIKGYQGGVKRRASEKEFEQTVNSMREKSAEALRSGNYEEATAAADQVKEAMLKHAENLTGTDAIAAKITARLIEKTNTQARAHEASLGKVIEAGVLQFSKLKERATIEQHRQLLRGFLEANANLTNTVTHYEDNLEADLKAAGVPAATLGKIVEGGRRGAQRIRPYVSVIRKCDQTIGESALDVLELLDKNWGKWSYNPSGRIGFQENTTIERYNALLGRIEAAGKEQADQQEKLARVQSRDAGK